MTLHRFLVASALTLIVGVSSFAQVPPSSQQGSTPSSHVQGIGVGSVKLAPTGIRLSIPIKIYAEASWDASEKLRETRKKIVERAEEMGAADPIRTVGFRCSQEFSRTLPIRQQSTPTPRYVAQCYVIADMALPEMDDHEAVAAVAQSQLEELVSLIPNTKSRSTSSISYATLSSGFTSRDFEQPIALFVAPVSSEDRKEAYRQALEAARNQVAAALEAIGVTSSTMSVHQQGSFISTTRRSHPAESAVFRRNTYEAVGTFAEGVDYTVRLSVTARFNSVE